MAVHHIAFQLSLDLELLAPVHSGEKLLLETTQALLEGAELRKVAPRKFMTTFSS